MNADRLVEQVRREGAAWIGPYRADSILGHGGMATVFSATDGRGRRVALKVLASGSLARFEREWAALAQLDHPGIVRVLDVGGERGLAWIAMEQVDGEPLDAALRRRDLREGAGLVLQVARALAHAHARGVVHRDMKAQNVLVRARDGRAVLTDFGVAREVDRATLTRTGALVGTPSAMAPEQVRGEPVTPATDVWALGVLLYEVLAGEAPFRGDLAELFSAILQGAPEPPTKRRAGVPRALEAVCLRALVVDPQARTPDAAAFARGLAAALGDGASGPSGWARPVAVAAGLLLAAGAVVVVSARPGAPPSAVEPAAAVAPPASATPAPLVSPRRADPLLRPRTRRALVDSASSIRDRALLDAAIAADPEWGWALLTRAAARAGAEPAGARLDLERALAAADPPPGDDVERVRQLLSQLEERGRAADAAAAALRDAPDDRRLEVEYAFACRAAERHEEAVAAFRRVLARDDTSWQVHFQLGGSLWSLEREEEAVQAYRRARERDRGQAIWPTARLAEVLFSLDRLAEAEAALERGFDIAPRDAELLTCLARIRLRQGKAEDALSIVREARTRPHTTRGRSLAWLEVEALVRLGRREEARAVGAAALERGEKTLELETTLEQLGE